MFHRSERLLLRPAWPEDWQAVHAAIADEGIVRNLATAPWPYSAADARAWCALPFTPEAPRFVITLADSGEVIGCIGIGPLPPEEGGGDAGLVWDSQDGDLGDVAVGCGVVEVAEDDQRGHA